MAKVCILSTVNVKHMTLVSLYTSYFKENNIEYDIIYIDKYDSEELTDAKNAYKFDLKINSEWSFLRKLKHYWKFKKYAINIMKNNDYEFIITWNLFTAFMFSRYLTRKMKGKYVVNIRDITSRFMSLINIVMKSVVKNSAFSTVSSKGFIKYLPNFEYTEMHSLNTTLLKEIVPKTKLKEKNEKIIITYIGYVVYYDNIYKLINELKNDNRYELRFYGEGTNAIKNYVSKNNIMNVKCIGRFEPQETSNLIQDADIIYNLYGHNHINLDNALSIKLYYATYLNVPILVFKNTYMETIAKKYGIGFSVDDDFSMIGDNLYNWYHSLNQDSIRQGCDEFIEEINKSHSNLEKLLNKNI